MGESGDVWGCNGWRWRTVNMSHCLAVWLDYCVGAFTALGHIWHAEMPRAFNMARTKPSNQAALQKRSEIQRRIEKRDVL